MADETILEITRTLTTPDLDASFEGQSAANGSFQCPVSALNAPMDSGVYAITSASAVSFTVAFNYTLPQTPTRIRLTLLMPNTSASMPGIGAVINNAINFALCLTGPTGDTTHKVFWEALP
jgi:hypothetical protein